MCVCVCVILAVVFVAFASFGSTPLSSMPHARVKMEKIALNLKQVPTNPSEYSVNERLQSSLAEETTVVFSFLFDSSTVGPRYFK